MKMGDEVGSKHFSCRLQGVSLVYFLIESQDNGLVVFGRHNTLLHLGLRLARPRRPVRPSTIEGSPACSLGRRVSKSVEKNHDLWIIRQEIAGRVIARRGEVQSAVAVEIGHGDSGSRRCRAVSYTHLRA